jgi:hypothetical protein
MLKTHHVNSENRASTFTETMNCQNTCWVHQTGISTEILILNTVTSHYVFIYLQQFNLFSGLAGTIYFLADLLHPKNAKFPAFDLP